MNNETRTPRGHGFGADDVSAIRQFMKDLDWTQERLANESGLSLPTIKLFLTGKRKLSAAASDRVVGALQAGHVAKNASDGAMRSALPRLSPEAAERIRAKANASLSEHDLPAVQRLTFEQALQMPLHEVIDAVTNEIESSPLSLLWSLGQSVALEDRRAAITAQVTADPRVHIAGAKEWIRHVEKQRDDLKGELVEVRRELLAANEELLETYRRVVGLEKELAEERQRK